MLGWFKKDPEKKLRIEYERLLADAQRLQQGGDIKGYAEKMAEAEAIGKQLDAVAT